MLTTAVCSDANSIFEYFNGKEIEAVQRSVTRYTQKEILHCDSEIKGEAIQNLINKKNIKAALYQAIIPQSNETGHGHKVVTW